METNQNVTNIRTKNPHALAWGVCQAYKEIYKTSLTKVELIKVNLIEIIIANRDNNVRTTHVAEDSADQDGIMMLNRERYRVIEPKKSKFAQIDVIKQRLKVDGTGQPAIFSYGTDLWIHQTQKSIVDAILYAFTLLEGFPTSNITSSYSRDSRASYISHAIRDSA